MTWNELTYRLPPVPAIGHLCMAALWTATPPPSTTWTSWRALVGSRLRHKIVMELADTITIIITSIQLLLQLPLHLQLLLR